MKALAINCSPAKAESNTALVLNPFIKGLEEAGAHVDLFYSYELKIKPCLGEYSCIFKTPGICFQNDRSPIKREIRNSVAVNRMDQSPLRVF